MKNLLASLIILLICSTYTFAQGADRSLRIGDYLYGNAKGDTISGRMFITLDSFYIVYQVVKDSAIHAPVIRGTWNLNSNMKDVNLKFDDGNIVNGIFVPIYIRQDYLIQLQIGRYIFTRSWPK